MNKDRIISALQEKKEGYLNILEYHKRLITEYQAKIDAIESAKDIIINFMDEV